MNISEICPRYEKYGFIFLVFEYDFLLFVLILKQLDDFLFLLNVGGRICIISFHSLEDKIVKEVFNKYTTISKELKYKLKFVEK